MLANVAGPLSKVECNARSLRRRGMRVEQIVRDALTIRNYCGQRVYCKTRDKYHAITVKSSISFVSAWRNPKMKAGER